MLAKSDYIIVGLGLAGIAVAEELRSRGKSFVVYENRSQTSSQVAGGMYNPVVLKRFNPVWKAKEQLGIALPFYKGLEEKFAKVFDHPIDILRVFKSIGEQNSWTEAADHPLLQDYLDPVIEENENPNLLSDFLLGRVSGTGRIEVRHLVSVYRKFLQDQKLLVEETFEHEELFHLENPLRYKDIASERIIFCEGNGMAQNPFFSELPLEGTKGELLTIHAPSLRLDEVVKSAIFVMPLGDDLYKIGATFNWTDKSNEPTEAGKAELLEKLKKVITCDFAVIDHEAGVRPTTRDRRPLVGTHPEHPAVCLLNGLGTRGVMAAPYLARNLISHLEDGTDLEPAIDLRRFL